MFNIIGSQNAACSDTERFGYPCCVSVQCILTEQSSNGDLQYYPRNTPTFSLFSIYDLYLLTPALEYVVDVNSIAGLGAVLDLLRVAGEYGGTMNYTLEVVSAQVCCHLNGI